MDLRVRRHSPIKSEVTTLPELVKGHGEFVYLVIKLLFGDPIYVAVEDAWSEHVKGALEHILGSIEELPDEPLREGSFDVQGCVLYVNLEIMQVQEQVSIFRRSELCRANCLGILESDIHISRKSKQHFEIVFKCDVPMLERWEFRIDYSFVID